VVNKWFRFMPFYFFIKSIFIYRREINKILKDKNIKKIISVSDNNIFVGYLFKRAKSLDIETFVIQWALSYPTQRIDGRLPLGSQGFLRMGVYLIHKYLRKFIIKIILIFFLGEDFTRVNGKTIASGPSQKFGVINKMAYEYFSSRGIKKDKMAIVGYLDFYFAERVKKEFDTNSDLKIKIANKYNINLNKKNITLYSSPLNTIPSILNDQEQREYVEKIIKTIRKILNEKDYDILFKIHPSEDINLYKGLENNGVKIYDKGVDNNKLIYFSDLHIGSNSTTSFIPMVMKKDIIFLNLFKLSGVEGAREYLLINQYIHSFEDFEKCLQEFRLNKLKKQYKESNDLLINDSLSKIINWIN